MKDERWAEIKMNLEEMERRAACSPIDRERYEATIEILTNATRLEVMASGIRRLDRWLEEKRNCTNPRRGA